MSVPVDITGQRFGRLVAIAPSDERRNGRYSWRCLCDCGAEAVMTANALRTGNTKSCGCLNRDKDYWPRRACEYCGQTYQPRAEGQRSCRSLECVRAYHAAYARVNRVPKAGPARPCEICGDTFQPIRPSNVVCAQRECRLAHKRKLAADRNAGVLRPGDTQIFCLICGKEVWAAPQTLVCESRDCLLARRRDVGRATRGEEQSHCIVCGARFWPADRGPGQHYTCSDRCKRIAMQRKNRRGYESRRDEALEEQARRLREDPEYAANRRAIDNAYRERKLRRAAERAMRVLQERLNEQ